MHRTSRTVLTVFARRMVPYRLWGKSAPIIPRLDPHREMPHDGLNRTSSNSLSQIRLFYRGR
jgi:hypothetical protein